MQKQRDCQQRSGDNRIVVDKHFIFLKNYNKINILAFSWKESYDQPRQHIQKQRHYFANKGPSSQGYGFTGFSSGHVCM